MPTPSFAGHQAWLYTYDVRMLWVRQAASRSLGEYDVDEEFEPHLNRMLRTELLYYTRVSIYMSVKEATKGPVRAYRAWRACRPPRARRLTCTLRRGGADDRAPPETPTNGLGQR